jgi:hypothetical protein
MRVSFVLGAVGFAALLAGCPAGDDGGGNFYQPGSEVAGCNADSDCSGQGANTECARDGECLPPSKIYAVKVTWTVNGQPANDSTCGDSPDLYLQFDDGNQDDAFGYAPVACNAGIFSVDKLPTAYVQADLGVNGTSRKESSAIDPSTGIAAIDLTP